jgi:hypothetical protein
MQERKVDSLYELKYVLGGITKPFAKAGKGARNLVKRKPKAVVAVAPVVKVERPARNYVGTARAKALFPTEFIQMVKSIGMDEDVLLARLRSLPLAIAGGHSFDEVWDSAMTDERLSETEKESLAIQAIGMLELDMRLDGVL